MILKKCELLCIAVYLVFCLCANAQTADVNLDTPNLSFEKGSMEGWKMYIGGFYLDGPSGEYKYEPWQQVNEGGNHFEIINNFPNTPDPIISCWDLYTNPDGNRVIRIGSTGKAENLNSKTTKSAMAEKLTYTFVVTENTALFTYKFATVLHVPVVSKGHGEHSGDQLPTFSVSADFSDGTKLPCGSFTVSADLKSGYALENVIDQPDPKCPSSAVRDTVKEYTFRRWTTGSYDLSDHIGKEITISIITHDCLNQKDTPGSHRAYGYFWAETKKLELLVKNCGLEDAVITAPEGFDKYEWTRSDHLQIKADPSTPNVAVIPQEQISAGVIYSCTMTTADGCTSIKRDVELAEVGLNMDFDYDNDCNGIVSFKNKTTINGDDIVGYSWDFGNGTLSSLETPDAKYMDPGDYDVTLTAFTRMGCSKSITKKVSVRFFPNLHINAPDSVCIGETVELIAMEASVGSRFLWSTGDTTQSIRVKLETSQAFDLVVKDEYLCEYTTSYWIPVKPSPQFLVVGDREICLNDTVTLAARAFVANDNITYIWNTGATTAEMKARPLKDNMEYTVTGTYKNGCTTTKVVPVKVDALPEITLTGDGSICYGDIAELHASALSSNGKVTYVWSDLFSGQERTVMPDSTSTYTVYGVDSMKCQSLPVSFTVKVKPLPTVTLVGDTVICEGKSAQFTASGTGSNVRWYDGTEGETTISRVPSQDTTYWVEGFVNGCSGKAEISVHLLDVPNVWIEPSTTMLCLGDTVTMRVMGDADSYVWNVGQTGDAITDVPFTTSEYSVVGTAANGGCMTTASVIVKVNYAPDIIITGDKDACDGETAHITASGAAEYFWSNNAYGETISVPMSADVSLSVRGIDQYGCEGTASWTITKKDLPVLSYTGDTTVCSGSTINIAATGANTYLWQDGSTSAVYTSVLESNAELHVRGFINGCSSDLLIPVKVLPKPAIWATGTGISGVCPDSMAYLVAHGADRYQWGGGETSDTIRFVPTVSSKFTLYGYSSDGCEDVIQVPVVVNPRPMVYTKGDNKACYESVANVVAYDANGENSNFVWSNGNAGSVINLVIFGDTAFTVTAENQFGCRNSTVHEIMLVDPPVLSFDGKTEICQGETTTLQGLGAQMFTWNDGNREVSGSSFSISPVSNTLVRMTGSDISNCQSELDIQILVYSPPTLFLSGDTIACLGDSISVYASGAKSYKWNTGDTTASISYNVGSTTKYTVQGTNSNGCTSTESFIVNVRPDPQIVIEKGLQTGCQDLPDTVRISAKGASLYRWTSEPYNVSVALTGFTDNFVAIIDTTTMLYVEGTDEFGCVGRAQRELSLLPRQEIDFRVVPSFIESGSSSVRFSGVTPTESVWYWDAGDGSPEQDGVNAAHRYDPNAADSFTVTVRAIDKYGCTYTGRQSVYTWLDFWAPDGFTPNSDELNDSFKFFGGEYMTDFDFIIYNRLGEIVFTGHSIDDEWDGTYEGKPCPWGVYGWYVKYKGSYMGADKSGERKGFVSLVR